MEPRPYQKEAIQAVNNQWKIVDKTFLVLPTGTGKTIIFCKLAEQAVSEGKRVLILAHRGELLKQAADKMMIATGLGCALEKAKNSCLDIPQCFYPIVVGSVQTLMRESRLSKFMNDYFDVIIVDETHHVLSDSYQIILKKFHKAKVAGVTATPDRGDKRELGEYFESLAYEYSIAQAIKEKYLCKIKAVTIPLKIDLSSVKTQSGDFQSVSLGNALDPFLEAIAGKMKEFCINRKTVVFLPLIATSKRMEYFLNKNGFMACEINGESKHREETIRLFESKDSPYNVLCNSMLLTEGWDCPEVDCIVCLRPTKIRSLYAQMIGRGTRLFPGKENLLILDFLWHTEKHELCRPAHLICPNEAVSKQMIINAENALGEEFDLQEAEEKAEGDCIEEREASLADKLAKLRMRKQKLVDPLQYEMSICAEDLAGYIPQFGSEFHPPTDMQKKALEKLGILPEGIESKGKASLMLDRLNKRRELGLSTPKQIRLLERYKFVHVGQWTFNQAQNMIKILSSNNWRLPRGIVPQKYNPPKNQHNEPDRIQKKSLQLVRQ